MKEILIFLLSFQFFCSVSKIRWKNGLSSDMVISVITVSTRNLLFMQERIRNLQNVIPLEVL